VAHSIGRFFSRSSTSNPSVTSRNGNYDSRLSFGLALLRSWRNEGGVFVLTRNDQPWYIKLLDLASSGNCGGLPDQAHLHLWAYFGGSHWQRFPSFFLSLSSLNGLSVFGQAESPGAITFVFNPSNQAGQRWANGTTPFSNITATQCYLAVYRLSVRLPSIPSLKLPASV